MTAGETVVDLVEAGGARDPGAVAAVAGGQTMTYADLDARANRLARHLQALGVGPDVPVGVCLERSLEMAVALVAVLKAGGACVPLDPSYPRQRLAFMVDDAAVAAVVTRSGLVDRLPAGEPVLRLDADAAALAAHPPTAPPREIGPGHLGYVIYTSGSTGVPKGVLLTHGGLVNHHRAAVGLYELGPGDRALQFCSIGFDASIEEMFPTWAAGATVVFRPEDVPLLGRAWLSWLRAQRVTVLNLPTAYWHQWTRDLDALGEPVPDGVRLVVVGGEKALGPAFRTWSRLSGRRSRWLNVYGPTETTCMSTAYEPPPDGAGIGSDRDPPIGRPLPGTVLRIVDEALAPVAPGVSGELLIGGAGLARGYLGRPELTAERFVPDPAGPAGARLYRTGDLVRQRPDGDLEFVGRIDDQVKIRGFRVECGEVETALARHPAVAAAAVVAREDGPGEKQLVAYVSGAAGATVGPGELRRFLGDRLPGHMVPSAVVVLDALPLTASGKVDRAGLPTPTPGGMAGSRARAAPRSPTEETIAAIWARVLGLDPAAVGVDDDFFELGGHSLLATQVVAQLREELGTETPLRAIFAAPTVAGLAAAVDAETGVAAPAPPLAGRARQPGERLPLSLAQEQMWALEHAARPPGLYNITALHRFDRPVDEDALRHALAYMVDRHETLRTGFGVESGVPYQWAAPTAALTLEVTELGDIPRSERDDERQRRVAEEDARPFDLSRPPLVRAHLLHLDDKTSELALTFDHLICDGTATSIFVAELLSAYDAIAAGQAPGLHPLQVQFGDFTVWQRSHVTDDVLRRQLEWWTRALDGMPLGPAVPFDRLPSEPTRRIACREITVPVGTRQVLDGLARATNSTLFIVTLAAVQALIAREGATTDVVVSTTLSGRNRAEVEGLVGMFSGIGRIRTDLSGDPAFVDVIARARERVLGMFENQDVPFMRVRRAVVPDFPTDGTALAKTLPVEFQYFYTSEGPEADLFFRGQLHPLSVTLLDDGSEIAGQFSYKLDFYDAETIDRLADGLLRVLQAVGADASLRVSQLPVAPRSPR